MKLHLTDDPLTAGTATHCGRCGDQIVGNGTIPDPGPSRQRVIDALGADGVEYCRRGDAYWVHAIPSP